MDDVGSWLRSIGLGQHADAFVAQGIEPDLLPQLDDADLKELGVTLLGQRKRLLMAIAALRAAAPGAGSASVVPDAPAAAPARDAERRQLTVMFCDLVGSTQLAARLDPEDLQQQVRAYHAAVAQAVAPFDGHLAQLLGDGCLVYFGYPRAHEDDAVRALHAALAVLRAVAGLEMPDGGALQTRIGIATGLVVVGEIGSGTAAVERSASGETPNLAARLQAQASPGEIMLSAETRRLVGASFEFEPAGLLALKGFAAPVEAWRLRGERNVASRFEAQHDSELTDLVGRSSEVGLLLERWQLARGGEGQVVLLSGEAGIGKSRICQALRDRLAGERHATVVLQCSPYHRSSALHPVRQYFERVTGIVPSDPPEARARKLERLTGGDLALSSTSFAQLLRLMDAVPAAAAPPEGDALQDKAQLLQAPLDLLLALARQVPVLMLIEDAHWIDPTTEEVVALAVEQSRDSRLLVVVTCRPDYEPSWRHPEHVTRLTLNRLGQRHCADLVAALTDGKPLPAEVLEQILHRTDGVPLFVEELTKWVLQSGLLDDAPDGYRLRGPLPALAIPATLQDSLMARLDRLAPAKEVAQAGAMIGREFSRRLVAAVLPLTPARLDEALDELVRSELIVRRGHGADAVYHFRHALIRDTAYHSLLRSQRALRHARIAEAIEQLEPDVCATHPELLAHHHQEGAQPEAALGCWIAAAELALARGAHREAAMHYRSALALLPVLADGAARHERELELQLKLGHLLMSAEGYGEASTLAAFARARELASTLGRIDTCVTACSGFSASLWASGRFDEALEMLGSFRPDELARLRPMTRVFHAEALSLVRLHLGDYRAADALTAQAVRDLAEVPAAGRERISGVDPEVLVLSSRVNLGVPMGRLDRAEADSLQAMRLADALGHPPTRAWALSLMRWLAFRKGDMEESIRIAEELLALAERLQFRSRIGSGRILMGRAVVAAGRVDEGERLLRDGFALIGAGGTQAGASEMAAIAADVLVAAGRIDAAAEFVAAGERAQARFPERNFAAELLRLRARVDQARGDARAAEAGLRQAEATATAQGARLFALRAATDLAALLQPQRRDAEALARLQPAWAALDEGRGYPELRRARDLLNSLSG